MCVHICMINDAQSVHLCSSHQAENLPASWQTSDTTDGLMKQLVSTTHTRSISSSGGHNWLFVLICLWMSVSVLRQKKEKKVAHLITEWDNEKPNNHLVNWKNGILELNSFQLLWAVKYAHLRLSCSHFWVHLNQSIRLTSNQKLRGRRDYKCLLLTTDAEGGGRLGFIPEWGLAGILHYLHFQSTLALWLTLLSCIMLLSTAGIQWV